MHDQLTRHLPAMLSAAPESSSPSVTHFGVVKIISGGQSGADRGGLEAAKLLGIETGGFAPHGYMTEDGPSPDLGSEYGLEEMSSMSYREMYPARSQKNVDVSDGTVAFSLCPSVGTDLTIGYCRSGKWKRTSSFRLATLHRPVFVVRKFSEEEKKNFQWWLATKPIRVLNVAGHRETSAGVPDFQKKVTEFLVSALSSEI